MAGNVSTAHKTAATDSHDQSDTNVNSKTDSHNLHYAPVTSTTNNVQAGTSDAMGRAMMNTIAQMSNSQSRVTSYLATALNRDTAAMSSFMGNLLSGQSLGNSANGMMYSM